jgi:hypothetical protein
MTRKLLLCAVPVCLLAFYWLVLLAAPRPIPLTTTAVATTESFASSMSSSSSSSSLQWHVKPVKPHHHGNLVCSAETDAEGNFVYKRTFTVPCGDGLLVFSVGPAASYEPYAYDLYDDAYVYSNNQGLCVFYPSYKGIQTSDAIMWTADDPTSMIIDLGDLPNKISTRVIKKPDTKEETKKGGDFAIMRSGNFYNPVYYKHLKNNINSWPANVDDMEARLSELVAALDRE